MLTSEKTKQQIVSKLKHGVKVKELIKEYKISKSSILRMENRIRTTTSRTHEYIFL